MSVLRSAPYTPLHGSSHWASRRFSFRITRGHVLGLLLALVPVPLLFNLLVPAAPAGSPHVRDPGQQQLVTDTRQATRPAKRKGFRGMPVNADLSLQDAATNHEYYRIMTSVCHSHGRDKASTGYAYLFHANNRYSHSGHWSSGTFDMAVDSIRGYFDIDPVADCSAAAVALRGIDLDDNLALKTNAYNHAFYSRKIGICRNLGNEVQARSYTYRARSELDKVHGSGQSRHAIEAAILEARTAPEMNRIHSC